MWSSGKHWVQTKLCWNWRNNWKDTFLLLVWFLGRRTAVKQCPREAASSPLLKVHYSRPDKTLSNLVWPHGWPWFQEEVRPSPPVVPPQPRKDCAEWKWVLLRVADDSPHDLPHLPRCPCKIGMRPWNLRTSKMRPGEKCTGMKVPPR